MDMRKISLVTGASRGVGRATVEHLSRMGHIVFAGIREVSGRNGSVARELGGIAEVLELDVADKASVNRAVDFIVDIHGRIDVVVNNAGYGLRGPVEETEIEDARRLFDINFFGCMRVAQAAMPVMRRQGSGTIVQISSISGKVIGSPLYGMYQASKHALEAMSEAMYYELKEFGVRIVIVEPGNLNTSFTVNYSPSLIEGESAYQNLYAKLQKIRKQRKSKRTDPEEVAAVIASAIEDLSSPLRILVGDDAKLLDQMRRSSTDEEFSGWVWDKLNC